MTSSSWREVWSQLFDRTVTAIMIAYFLTWSISRLTRRVAPVKRDPVYSSEQIRFIEAARRDMQRLIHDAS